MKKVFSLLLATVLSMGMFAQTKTIATVEKLWSGSALSWSTSNTRQWTGYGDHVYWNDKALHAIVGTHDGSTVDTIFVNDAIDGTAFCVDGVGNFIVEGTFPNTPSHVLLVKHDTTAFVDLQVAGLARTDIVTATGDVFSAEGGYVFLYGNSANLLILAIKNAGAENQEVITKTVAIAGSNVQNFVVAGDTTVQYVMRRSSGQTGFDKYENGVNTGSIAGMTGYKASTLGGAMVTLSNKEFAVYPVGSVNYSSEFSVFNITDSAMVVDKSDASKTTFCANTTTAANSTNVGVFVNASKIDDNSAYIQVGNGSDGVALFKLNVTIAAEVTLSCDETQGTVTGAGDVAVGANATVKAVANPGYEFVAWKKGDEVVSNSATYTFTVNEHVSLTAVFEARENVNITLAVNDAAKGGITLPEGVILGANSIVYGTPVELTAVPAEGMAFYGWYEGETLYSEDAQIALNGKASISLMAKFVTILPLSYELNGGVANTYGWINASTMFKSFMEDSEAKAGFKTLEEFLAMPEKLGDPGICTYLTNPEKAFANEAKWGWLKTYIESVHAAQAEDGASVLPANGAGAAWRYAVGAFFIDGQRTGWPKSADFATCGVSTLAAYQAIWQGAFANPTEVVKDFTLNTPYKEGFTFAGWYPNADFSGEKVLSVNYESNIPGNTLYAKWIEYVPTIAEALAADSAANVKVGGVVTFIRGTKNVYIQDATGGVLLYTKNNATCQVGDFVIVTGKNVIYGGAPEISNAEITGTDTGHDMPGEITTTIATLVANPLKYFCQRVKVEGVYIAKYDDKGNVFVTDNVDTVQCYYVTPPQASFPVGAKVNLHLIAAYFNGFQFVGPNDGIEIASAAAVDPYQYPALGENGEYTLTNKWLYTTVMDNFSDNAPGAADQSRGMVAKDGKMYFINNMGGSSGVKGTGRFIVVDGATGTMLDPINIVDNHLFETQDSTGAYKFSATLSFNDVKLDNAGHFLIGGCISSTNTFQIYKVDIATGAATELISERLIDNEEWGQQLDTASTKYRFDAFNVYGDVDSKAIIMAADANSFYVYKWTIEGGVAGKAERINCTPDPLFDESLLIKDGGLSVEIFGTAPQVFPVDFNFFYVDGWYTLPMLFDMDGNLAEDFISCPTGVNIPMAGDTCTMNMGHNGLCEFQIGDEYFLVMAATNTVGTPTSAFAIYKFADAAKSFEGLTPMWFFPKAGMGSLTNGCRTAVPSVEVDGTKATIYVYTHNNGYGVYEMTGLPSGLNNVNDDVKAVKIIENGQVYIIRNGVRYTVLGAQVK